MAAPTRAQLSQTAEMPPEDPGFISLSAKSGWSGPHYIATEGGIVESLALLSVDTAANGETQMASHSIQIPDGVGEWTWSHWKGVYWAVADSSEEFRQFEIWKATDLSAGVTTLDLWIATAQGAILEEWPAGELALFELDANTPQADNSNPGDNANDVAAVYFRNHYSSATALAVDTWHRSAVSETVSFTAPFWLALKVFSSASSGFTTLEIINYSYIHW